MEDKEKTNILSGGIETLYTMKENLLELTGYREKSSTLAQEEADLERQLNAKEKELNDEINSVTKKRKDELSASFDEQLSQTRTRIKKVKGKKDKTKSAKVSERIEIETSELREEKTQYLEEIKKLYKSEKIPSVFNNWFYYSLFMPNRLKDLGVILLTLALVLVAIPFLLYNYVFPEHVLWLVLSYVITVLVFGGLYVAINRITKEKHADTYQKIKTQRSKALAAQKKINSMKRAILKDKDESSYGLDKFNEELQQLDDELAHLAEEKKKAMVTFESVTKYAIAEDIKARYEGELKELEQEHSRIYEEQRKAEDMGKQFALEISAKYEPFIGKEIMSIPLLDKMITVMETGNVSTIAEALAHAKGNIEQEGDKKLLQTEQNTDPVSPQAIPVQSDIMLLQENSQTNSENTIPELKLETSDKNKN